MNSASRKTCPKCGAKISSDRAEQLCPACLMAMAMELPDSEEFLDLPNPNHMEFPFILGDYRLLKELGRGGMGRVYEAEQLKTGRRIALKMLAQPFESELVQQRFLREGRLAASVNHPNSLYVFGVDVVDGLPVILMELAPGGTLMDRIERSGSVPRTEAVDMMLDIISGLEAAHTKGVLHRDIKPSNCFIRPDGAVQVGDYGLSVSLLPSEDTTMLTMDQVVGTPTFASPEQLKGDSVDVRSDIYSVGATLYLLLTGKVPFTGENPIQTVANVLGKQPIPLRKHVPSIPENLESVVLHCLNKNPSKRFDSYAGLKKALLPHSSKGLRPASVPSRLSAGWIDFLIAFLPPYLGLMLTIGGERLLVTPLQNPGFREFSYLALLLAVGMAYFTIAEGLFKGGPGKKLLRLAVVAKENQPPGMLRSFLRISTIIFIIEAIRIPTLITFIGNQSPWNPWTTLTFIAVTTAAATTPGLLGLFVKKGDDSQTIWDMISGTRVVHSPRPELRPNINAEEFPLPQQSGTAPRHIGPYLIISETISQYPLLGYDPDLRRHVWLVPGDNVIITQKQKGVSRIGRLRWLQSIDQDGTQYEVFEAIPGKPFLQLLNDPTYKDWDSMKFWLSDIASECWAAEKSRTLPSSINLSQFWVAQNGHIVWLDFHPTSDQLSKEEPWKLNSFESQQQLLEKLVDQVSLTSVPLKASSWIQNLKTRSFDKLMFLAGSLKDLLAKPGNISVWNRIAATTILPGYTWIAALVGHFHDKPWVYFLEKFPILSFWMFAGFACVQLLIVLSFKTTIEHSIFRLAVVDKKGTQIGRLPMLYRWALTWLFPLVPIYGSIQFLSPLFASSLILFWVVAAVSTAGLMKQSAIDRLSNTWIVRQ